MKEIKIFALVYLILFLGLVASAQTIDFVDSDLDNKGTPILNFNENTVNPSGVLKIDLEGDFTFSIEEPNEDDYLRFSIINNNTLVLNLTPDFENPVDTALNNGYAVVVTATDLDGNAYTQFMMFWIKDVLNEVDGLDVDFDTVDKGYYKIYKDNVFVSQHSKQTKAISMGIATKFENKDSYIVLKQPDIEFTADVIGEYKVVANIVATELPTKKAFIMDSVIPGVEFGNTCAEETSMLIISKVPFDFKDQKVILNNATWYAQYGLLNNGESITDIEALSLGLVELNCTKAQLIIPN